MKNLILLFTGLLLVSTVSCTDDFDEINTQPDALSTEDISAKFFVTEIQQRLLKGNMFPRWLGNVIHVDQFAGQSSNGWAGSSWDGDLGWLYNAGWSDGGCWNHLSGYNTVLTSFLNNVKEGGPLEDEMYYALGLIWKGVYYQQFTDAYGMIPYTEASDPNIALPKYDDQLTIYKGIIAELDEAIAIIGDKTEAGNGFGKLAENDVIFKGNMQNWKQMANSLKLRLALRAHGASGESFSATAALEAIQSGVLADVDGMFESFPAETNIWGPSSAAAYGDVWAFGGGGSDWRVSQALTNAMKTFNDPRLSKMTKPAVGGTMTITKPTTGAVVGLIDDHVAFVKSTLDAAGLIQDQDYMWTETDTDLTITMPENTNYIGMPSRISPKLKAICQEQCFQLLQTS